jgi:hypothetical protein
MEGRGEYREIFNEYGVTDISITAVGIMAMDRIMGRLHKKWSSDAWVRKWFYYAREHGIDLQNSFEKKREKAFEPHRIVIMDTSELPEGFISGIDPYDESVLLHQECDRGSMGVWNNRISRGPITFNPDEEVYMGDGWIKQIEDADPLEFISRKRAKILYGWSRSHYDKMKKEHESKFHK